MRVHALSISLALLVTFTTQPSHAGITIFSSGYQVPESISLAPSSFGPLAGQLIVVDPGLNNATGVSTIYSLPTSGGAPTAVTTVSDDIVGGTFVPSGFGQSSGQYLFGGANGLFTMSGNGAINQIADINGIGYNYATGFAQAPQGFGSNGGGMFFGTNYGPDASGNGGILVLNPSGQISVFQTVLPGITDPFGLAFAPNSFGAFSNQLLVSDAGSGLIDAITAGGSVSTFATLPLSTPDAGLRQMMFIPEGYGAFGGDLLVSDAGSNFGGGNLGELYILNGLGQIVAQLDSSSLPDGLDPRGMLFLNNNTLLLSDAASGDILAVTASSFASVPEPQSVVMVGAGMIGLVFGAIRRRRKLAA
jgi:hypothetical protein